MLGALPAMLVRYKAIIRDGYALNFADALSLERTRGRQFNAGLSSDALESRREGVRERNRSAS
jgi:enoyl-CoA hydratase